MSQETITQLIQVMPAMVTALGFLVTAGGTVYNIYLNYKTKHEISSIKEHVNSKMDKLLEVTGIAAGLEGEKRGRELGTVTLKGVNEQ